jgi:hypothetical protein
MAGGRLFVRNFLIMKKVGPRTRFSGPEPERFFQGPEPEPAPNPPRTRTRPEPAPNPFFRAPNPNLFRGPEPAARTRVFFLGSGPRNSGFFYFPNPFHACSTRIIVYCIFVFPDFTALGHNVDPRLSQWAFRCII